MWTDVQRLGFRDAATEATNRPNPCLSTLSLRNANFGPEVSLGNTMSEGDTARGNR
jgi:hypothetical protein